MDKIFNDSKSFWQTYWTNNASIYRQPSVDDGMMPAREGEKGAPDFQCWRMVKK